MASADNEFVDYLIDQMNEPRVHAKRMFGGFGFYYDEVFFGLVDDGVLYLKTNDRSQKWYLDRGMSPFRPTAKQTLKRYFEVPEDILEDREALHERAEEAWRIAGTEKF